jgi:transcriptional regulator with XRE-family HTH domain
VAKRVRQLRIDRVWTQRELAAELELSQNRLSELENGQGSFSAEHLLRILQLFNVGISLFADEKPDPEGQLQNALNRFGAKHLLASDQVLAVEQFEDLRRVVLETIVAGHARVLTALAPVLVENADLLELNSLASRLDDIGLGNRLYWICENVIWAIRADLDQLGSQSWRRRYRRALTVLEQFIATVPPPPLRSLDLLDSTIRSEKTITELKEQGSEFSARWHIVTSLQPADFLHALREARGDA